MFAATPWEALTRCDERPRMWHGHEALKSVDIYGGMAQSVGRLKQVIQLGNNLLESNGFCAFETKCKLFLNIQKVCSIMLKIIESHKILRPAHGDCRPWFSMFPGFPGKKFLPPAFISGKAPEAFRSHYIHFFFLNQMRQNTTMRTETTRTAG